MPDICGKCADMAIEKIVTEEMKKNAVDLLVMMVVDELCDELHKKPAELLPEFVTSRTGRLLYDEESRLWWSGPSDIAQMFKEEMERRSSKARL